MTTAAASPARATLSAGRALLLGLALLACRPGCAQITIPAGTGDQMLAGMMSMMAEFAKQFQNYQGGSLSAGMGGLPMSAASQAYNPMSGGMMGAPGMGSQLGQAGNAALAAMGSGSLDGAWRGQNGEILLIEGRRFRLHADPKRYLDGRLGRRGNIVGFLYPERETALLYRYQISGNRLALQSRDRNIRYFQRLHIGR